MNLDGIVLKRTRSWLSAAFCMALTTIMSVQSVLATDEASVWEYPMYMPYKYVSSGDESAIVGELVSGQDEAAVARYSIRRSLPDGRQVQAFSAAQLSGALATTGNIIVPNDYATIQSAVDAAAPGSEIIIKRGTYEEADVLVTTPGISITGRGATLKGDLLIAAENVSVTGLDIVGRFAAFADNASLTRMTIIYPYDGLDGFYDGAVLSKPGVQGLRVQQVDIARLPGSPECTEYGICFAVAVFDGSNVLIDRVTVAENFQFGVVTSDSEDVTVTNSQMTGSTEYGDIWVQRGTRHTINNNQIHDGRGIFFRCAGNSTIANNTVRHSKNGIYVDAVESCRDIPKDFSYGNTIFNNEVYGTQQPALLILFTSQQTITYNRIEDARFGGILGFGSEYVIQHNSVKDSTLGISMEGENHDISHNDLVANNRSPGCYGCSFGISGPSNSIISNNTVRNHLRKGIFVRSSQTDNLIEQNTMINNGDCGECNDPNGCEFVGVEGDIVLQPPFPVTTPNLVDDPGFEAGAFAGFWDESSTNFGTPLCDEFSCGFNGARQGGWWAWFGGAPVEENTGLGQHITLPAGDGATLTYWMWLTYCSGDSNEYFEVTVNGETLDRIEMDSSRCTGPESVNYQQLSFDISDYLDSEIDLQFYSHTGASGDFSGIFVDDVEITVFSQQQTNVLYKNTAQCVVTE